MNKLAPSQAYTRLTPRPGPGPTQAVYGSPGLLMPRHRNVNRSVHLHHAFHPSIHVYHPDQANPFPQKQTPNNLQKKTRYACLSTQKPARCLPPTPPKPNPTKQIPTIISLLKRIIPPIIIQLIDKLILIIESAVAPHEWIPAHGAWSEPANLPSWPE